VPAFAPFPLPLTLVGFDAELSPPADVLQEAIGHRLTLARDLVDAFGEQTATLEGTADFLLDARDAVWGQLTAPPPPGADADAGRALPGHPRVRLFLALLDIAACSIKGIVVDAIVLRGWNAIDRWDLCEWLARHGAQPETVRLDDPAKRTPALRCIYDLAFGYRDGDMAKADISAGTAMSNLLKLAFGYHGSLYYKMAAGMGDTVFGPFYEVLEARGVKFRFFHAVERIDLTADKRHVGKIQLVRQAKLAPRRDEYEPLVDVGGLPCWPSLPRAGQLADPAAVEAAGTAFERELDPLGTKDAVTLTRCDAAGAGQFDDVVLAISVAALPGLCPELERPDSRYKKMLDASVTVATQAFQLWMTDPALDLGWPFGPWSVAGAYLEPLDTYADMSHLLGAESWTPVDGVSSIAYFCGVLREPAHGAAAVAGSVHDDAVAFLNKDIAPIWPKAVRGSAKGPSVFRWDLLARAPAAKGAAPPTGPPADAPGFYAVANTDLSDRYVLTPKKTIHKRLRADQSGVANLLLAGDWTRNGVDGGCVEAAVLSGLQAARAITREARPFTGEDDRWLAGAGGGPPAAGRGPSVPAPAPTAASPVRASRPPYVEYGGRATAPAPFRSLDGSFRGLVLRGDRDRIEALCDRVYNAPAGGAARYRPVSDYVLMLVGSFGRVTSATPPFDTWGSVRETTASFWVPLVASYDGEGAGTAARFVIAVPYIFVDNPMSYAGGREDYGYPKSMAQFTPADASGPSVRVKTFGGNFHPGNQAGWQPVLDIGRGAKGTPAPRLPRAAIGRLLPSPASWRRLTEVPDLVRSLLSDSAHREVRQVFLKQFRDAADGTSACYQAVVEAPITVVRSSWRPSLFEQWHVDVHRLDSHPIAAELGITSQSTWLTYELSMDMIAEPASFVTPPVALGPVG
jgi:uncharacterized protein with NAD-binding domain and iron-sulfur cluster